MTKYIIDKVGENFNSVVLENTRYLANGAVSHKDLERAKFTLCLLVILEKISDRDSRYGGGNVYRMEYIIQDALYSFEESDFQIVQNSER